MPRAAGPTRASVLNALGRSGHPFSRMLYEWDFQVVGVRTLR